MMEGEACLLGSFNLSEYIIEDEDGYVEFDTDNFKNDIHTVVVAMNEVQEESIERLPLEKQKIMAEQYRRIGIGIMGLADCLIKLNIRYGSNRSVKFCDNLGYIMANEALKASEGLSWCSGNFLNLNLTVFLKVNTSQIIMIHMMFQMDLKIQHCFLLLQQEHCLHY